MQSNVSFKDGDEMQEASVDARMQLKQQPHHKRKTNEEEHRNIPVASDISLT